MEVAAPQSNIVLKDTVKVPEGWKKKRGPKRGILTLGGVKRLETARKRKQKRNLNRKLGMLGVQEGWKKKRGSLPPTRSVLFVDNTVGGVLYKRLQESEDAAGSMSGYRVRVAESAGTPFP